MISPRRVIRAYRVAERPFVSAKRGLVLFSCLAGFTLHAAVISDLSLGITATTNSDLRLTSEGEITADVLAHYGAALQLEAAGKNRQALEHYLAVFKADPTNAGLAEHTAGLVMQLSLIHI